MDPVHSFGSMVFSFQQMENDFVELFDLLLKGAPQKASVIISSNLSFSKLVDIVDALIRSSDLSEEIKRDAESLIRKTNGLESDRNKFIHSHYDIVEISGAGVTYGRLKRRIKRNKGYNPDYERITDSSSFDALSARINAFTWELQDLTEKIFFAKASQDEIDWYISQ